MAKEVSALVALAFNPGPFECLLCNHRYCAAGGETGIAARVEGQVKQVAHAGQATAIAVLEDFQQIVTGLFVERLETPVVQDQDLNMAQRALQSGIPGDATSEHKLGKQPWEH